MRRLISLMAVLMVSLLFALQAVAADISFSGGYTKVNLQEGNKTVTLSGGAKVSTPDIEVLSDAIELYGDNYRYVDCTGNVRASQPNGGISFSSPSLFYDRQSGLVSSDSWIEIQDTDNQAALSAAWFEYDMDKGIIQLKMMAKIVKVTEEGLMVCRADVIEFDSKSRKMTMKGNSNVNWNGDSYSAAMIVVDLDTNAISMYGSISGEVNG
ncbi:MAG: LptA/OstA family protein [Sphaerochaetaceae bacterium]|nr:LptA/OstA family protein [Sphaerochaetaceae bacterium]